MIPLKPGSSSRYRLSDSPAHGFYPRRALRQGRLRRRFAVKILDPLLSPRFCASNPGNLIFFICRFPGLFGSGGELETGGRFRIGKEARARCIGTKSARDR